MLFRPYPLNTVCTVLFFISLYRFLGECDSPRMIEASCSVDLYEWCQDPDHGDHQYESTEGQHSPESGAVCAGLVFQ